MELELDEKDLQLDCKDVPTSAVTFEHLTKMAQTAVTIVGRATFYRDRGGQNENYNSVHPPK